MDGPHDVRDRAPALDDRAGRRDRRARARADRRAGHARRAAGAGGPLPRDRREGAAGPGVPDAQAGRGGAAGRARSADGRRAAAAPPALRPRAPQRAPPAVDEGVSALGSGALGSLTTAGREQDRLAELRRRLRQTGGRGRKLRGLVELLRPYRGRVALMFVTLVLATGAALAPIPLATKAIDDGDPAARRAARSTRDRARVPRRRAGRLGRLGGADLPDRLGRPARAAGPARAAVPPPAVALARLLLARARGRRDQPHHERRRGARLARLRRDRDAVPVDADADRRRRDPARDGRRSSRSGRSSRSRCWRSARSPSGSPRRTPSAARASGSRAITGYLQETLSGIRVVRSFGQERRHIARFADLNQANRDGEHDDGLPQRRLLPRRRAAVVARDRRDPRRSAASR